MPAFVFVVEFGVFEFLTILFLDHLIIRLIILLDRFSNGYRPNILEVIDEYFGYCLTVKVSHVIPFSSKCPLSLTCLT